MHSKSWAIGRLGQDPEKRISKSGEDMATFRLAEDRWVPAANNQGREETIWWSVIVFGNQAQRCLEHLHKGHTVLVEGKVRARPWTTAEGEVRASLDLTADEVRFIARPQRESSKGPEVQESPTAGEPRPTSASVPDIFGDATPIAAATPIPAQVDKQSADGTESPLPAAAPSGPDSAAASSTNPAPTPVEPRGVAPFPTAPSAADFVTDLDEEPIR